jgi:hypothetical protein
MNQGVAIAIPLSPRNIRIALDVALDVRLLRGQIFNFWTLGRRASNSHRFDKNEIEVVKLSELEIWSLQISSFQQNSSS